MDTSSPIANDAVASSAQEYAEMGAHAAIGPLGENPPRANAPWISTKGP